jgi:pimeloyl-ACP methyl ester carboxylesterase
VNVDRHFVRIPAGEIHYAEAGSGEPLLLLHQTPRSWREYERVLPLLAPHRRVIAMDTIGYGDSTSRADSDSIEEYTAAVVQFLDALGLEHLPVVGHHTGGVIAIELAATYPERIDAIVLSCTPHTNDAHRAKPYKPVDDVPFSPDGTHAAALWRKRQEIYPPGRPDLLTAFLIDALKAGRRATAGHRAVTRFVAEEKLPLVKAPSLLIAGTLDPCYPDQEALARELGDPPAVEIEGGMCPLPEQHPERFTTAVLEFLDGLATAAGR